MKCESGPAPGLMTGARLWFPGRTIIAPTRLPSPTFAFLNGKTASGDAPVP
jgi:hypothetical protein